MGGVIQPQVFGKNKVLCSKLFTIVFIIVCHSNSEVDIIRLNRLGRLMGLPARCTTYKT
jgi:hypothetical protein